MNDLTHAIVICTEPDFEWKSRLLVRSIRTFGGRLSSIRIISYSPRPDCKPSRRCLDEFRSLDVEVITSPLNVNWPDYRLANKILACAHAEENLKLSKIAFVDSDQIVLSEFGSLFETTAPFSARPVDLRNIGVLNSDDYEAQYWEVLYRICGVNRIRTVETTVCRSIIREYFDSGMFSVAANAGILSAWKDNFEQVWSVGTRPRSGDYFIEQSCLSATVSGVAEGISLLPSTYNLPMETWHRQLSVGPPSMPIEADPVSLHYHRLFDDVLLDDLMNFARTFVDLERCSWIRHNVKELYPGDCTDRAAFSAGGECHGERFLRKDL